MHNEPHESIIRRIVKMLCAEFQYKKNPCDDYLVTKHVYHMNTCNLIPQITEKLIMENNVKSSHFYLFYVCRRLHFLIQSKFTPKSNSE